MRWPLRYQVLLPMAALMLVALVSVSALNAYLSVRIAKAQIRDQLSDVAVTLSQGSFPLTDAVLRQTRGLSGAEFVVADASGSVMSSSRTGLILPRLRPPQMAGELTLEEIVRIGDVSYFHIVVGLPRRSAGNDQAILHIFYPEDRYSAALWNAVLPPLLVGGVALLLVAVLATIVAARVTRPLSRLRSQVERIACGEFQPMPLPRHNDEILDLGQSVNRMAAMLADYEEGVRRNERLRTLGQLIGGMAHKLRNATTGCRMALDLHRRDCTVEGESETLSVARRQLELMERYLNQFFSRPNAAATPHAPVDLVTIVDDVLLLVSPNAEHLGVRVRRLPTEQSVFVDGDADDLGQLVINLMLNAIDAATIPNKSENCFQYVGTVVVQLKPAIGDRVSLEVRDSGPGPIGEVRGAMFEPLVTGKMDGTGLGLSVAQEIAMQHKSEIRWERRDETTCFVVELPLSRMESECVEVTGR